MAFRPTGNIPQSNDFPCLHFQGSGLGRKSKPSRRVHADYFKETPDGRVG
jgi:hypothetical protein